MITYYQLQENKPLKKTTSFHKNSWVKIVDPTEKELTFLAKMFHLELGHLQDALDTNEVPRFEEEDDCAYMYTRVPILQNDSYTTLPVLFILHPQAVFSIAISDVPIFTKVITNTTIQQDTTLGLFIQFFNEIVTQYYNAISKINKLTASKTFNIDRIENRDIVALVVYEQILNEFLNAIIQTNTLLKTVNANKKIIKKETDQDLTEDLFLSTGQLIEISKSSLRQVQNIREAYSTVMTNNLNRVIKFFTALTIVLTIPMIITSFYGMNVSLPFATHPLASIAIFVSIIILSISAVFIFTKQHWI